MTTNRKKRSRRLNPFIILEIALGATISILLAELLGLQFASSAGITTLLTIQNSRDLTLKTTLQRYGAFVLMLALSFALMQPLRFTVISFGLFLLFFRQQVVVVGGRVLREGDALPFDCSGDDRGGRSSDLGRVVERLENLRHVVSVDLEGLPSEGVELAADIAQVVAVARAPHRLDSVHVDDGGQIVQLERRSRGHRLPDLPLGKLSVPEDDPCAVVQFVESSGERHAHAYGEPLSERAGIRLHAGSFALRMPLEDAAERLRLAA